MKKYYSLNTLVYEILYCLACILSFIVTLTLPVYAASYSIPNDNNILGKIKTIQTQKNDSFMSIARLYNVPYNVLINANTKFSVYEPNQYELIIVPNQIILPNIKREGIVINLAEFRLYYFSNKSNKVHIYPIGIGKLSTPTPRVETTIIQKIIDPVWNVPESIRHEYFNLGQSYPKVIPSSPQNPLGTHALRLELPGYLIHGTNRPNGVGTRVSHGCIRLYPEDIIDLFSRVEIGTPVNIIHHPYKIGWDLNQLYLEAHTPLVEFNYTNKENIEKMLSEIQQHTLYSALESQIGVNSIMLTIEKILDSKKGVPIKLTSVMDK